MRLVMKTAGDGNLGQRKFSSLDEAERSLNALAGDELMWCPAHGRTKLTGEMEWTHVRLLGQSEQRQTLVQV